MQSLITDKHTKKWNICKKKVIYKKQMQKDFLTRSTGEYFPHDAENLDWSSRFKEIGEHI